jgi:hypothetical protein
LRIAFLTTFVFLMAATAGAQDQLAHTTAPADVSGGVRASVDEISLSAKEPGSRGTIPTGDEAGAYGAASNSAVSDAPRRHRVIDKKFIIVMGALGGAESMRFTTRKLVLEHEYAAGAPWVTQVPSTQGWVGKYSGIYASEMLVAYELKKPHSWVPGDKVVRRLWWAYPAAMTAIHIKNAVGNIRTQGPGGCASIACATQEQMQ